MAKKSAAKKSASKKTKLSLKTTSGASASDIVVIQCIKAQSGGATITPTSTLGGLSADGFILAGCINSKLATKFKGSDFPPSMTVAQCILLVRSVVKTITIKKALGL